MVAWTLPTKITRRSSGAALVPGVAPLNTGAGGILSGQLVWDAVAKALYIGSGDDGAGNSTGIAAVGGQNSLGVGFRNRVHNGDFRVAQRGTSFSSPASGAYTLDRWFVTWGGAAPATVAQVAGPAGFRNAAQITGAAGNTSMMYSHRIEAANCADLAGQTATLQANIAVSVAQTVKWVVSSANAADNFSSVTQIATGTFSATTTAITFSAPIMIPLAAANGLQITFCPQNGGVFTSGTFTITGVQLEPGNTATPFEFRPYGLELYLCQRYYEQISSSSGYNSLSGVGLFVTASVFRAVVDFQATKRAIPAFASSAPSTFNVAGPANYAVTSIAAAITNYQGAWLTIGVSGATAGQAAFLTDYNTAAYMGFSAEL